MALFVGALLIHGVQPGPLFMKNYPELFWGVVASMYVGNRHAPCAQPAVDRHLGEAVKGSLRVFHPLILLFLPDRGLYLNNNVVEIFIMVISGIVGLLLRRVGFEGAPFLLALSWDRRWKARSGSRC